MNDAASMAPTLGPSGRSEAIPRAGRRLPTWLGIAVVLALTFAAYAPTLGYKFVHDDRGQIVENPAVHSWQAFPKYFTAQVWAGVTPDDPGNYYRPLFLIWVRVNDQVFGNHAWGWHLTTVLAHLLTTFLVYLLVLRLGASRDVGLMAALIFGLHPAHIEGVAWISGVTEPLLGILLIGSFLCYLQWRAKGTRAFEWKVLSVALFILAILEKETAMVFPGLLLVYDWMFERKCEKRWDLRAILRWSADELGKILPYLFVIALYLPARIHALKGFSHVVTPFSITQMVITWPSLVAFWIRHLIWPTGLSTFYNLSAVLEPTFKDFTVPAIFVIAIGLAVFAAVRNSRLASFFAVWLVLPLVPLLNIRVFLANDFAHDRYLYLPSVGFSVLVAMLLKKLFGGSPRWLGMTPSYLAAGLCLGALMTYGTITESSYFRDNLTFYKYVVARAPHNPYAETNYATLLAEGGQYGPAIERFLDVASYDPGYYNAIYNLGLTYYKLQKLPEAETWFLRAIRTNPHKSDQYFYLSLTYFKSGRTPEAITAARRAIAIRPDGFAYHLALGLMLKNQGDLSGALREFQQEAANNPGEQAAVKQAQDIESQLTSGRR